ncbi:MULTISPECIES: glycosyltransferase family 2 protein [unclassified Aureispira]|uniref:glycosyltransferase family 2 protein n=1 Tax=unclassified Aureispira TaxID=2649989 RepID=UPI00069602D0|nr:MULTISPECIES: glycosyltransferase family 2 protein [unclassified Aureispira]WMX12487.1 glycosyltransferase family 2 protein [Aureispira sp. CCB-E]
MSDELLELTILMPCLNEELTLGTCIKKAKKYLEENNIRGEIVIGDNGSTDRSIEIAESLGARVINIPQKGYGSALIGGIKAAKGKYVIMGDSDDSYDFSRLMPYVEKLREGNDLVMGNRFKGGIEKGAMPFLHKYLGNPVLSFIGRLFFNTSIGDFHCGLRGFNRERMLSINLECPGMEFASEMVVKSILNDFKIAEVPTTLSKDGRDRPPHLNTWTDGWRHLRFLLLYSPAWLFLYPGIVLFLLGTVLTIMLLLQPLHILGIELDIHTLAYSATSIFIGFQLMFFFVFSRIYASMNGLLPPNKLYNYYKNKFSLEKGLILGGCFILLGIALVIAAWLSWQSVDYGDLKPRETLRTVIPSIFFLIGGIQIAQSSFLISILELKKTK